MKFGKNRKLIICASLLSMSLACGEPEEEEAEADASSTTASDPTGMVNSSGVSVGNTASFSLIGTWAAEKCIATSLANLQDSGDNMNGDEGGDEELFKISYTFKGDGTLAMRMQQFVGTNCTNPFIEVNLQANYLVGRELNIAPPIKELDTEIISGTLAFNSQEAVDGLNGVGSALVQQSSDEDDQEGGGEDVGGDFPCTKTGPWVLNEAVSLEDLDCSEGFFQVGEKMFEVVSVVDDKMMMGKDEDDQLGKTAATRNTALDEEPANAFTKQVVTE